MATWGARTPKPSKCLGSALWAQIIGLMPDSCKYDLVALSHWGPRPWLEQLYARFTREERKQLAEKNAHVKMVTKTIQKGKVRVYLAPALSISFECLSKLLGVVLEQAQPPQP